jgi:hypothetical protein
MIRPPGSGEFGEFSLISKSDGESGAMGDIPSLADTNAAPVLNRNFRPSAAAD